jgi:hypothetical protein
VKGAGEYEVHEERVRDEREVERQVRRGVEYGEQPGRLRPARKRGRRLGLRVEEALALRKFRLAI